jgi:hypothetical protein
MLKKSSDSFPRGAADKAWLGLNILFWLYVCVKVKYLWVPIRWSFIPAGFVIDWIPRMIGCLVVTGVWLAFALFVRATARRQDWKLSLPMLFFSVCGLSLGLLLLPSRFGILLGPLATRGLLMAPVILLMGVISYCFFQPPKPYVSKEESGDLLPLWLKLSFLLLCIMSTTVLLMAFLWLPLKRGVAFGDEYYFWWSASNQLPILGLSHYMLSYGQAHYSPGYPSISNVMLGFVPLSFRPQVEIVLPFMYGIALLGFLIPWNRRGKVSLSWMAATSVVFTFLIFSHQWVYFMFFQRWYGEAMAIGVVTSLFLAIDPSCFSVRSPVFEAIGLFGLGVIARLCKPPLETLVIPVVIPVLFLLNFLMNRSSGNWKTTAKRIAWMAAGALVGQHLWHHLLSTYHRTGHFEYPLEQYKHFAIAPVLHEVKDIGLHYKQVWFAYIFCCVAALRMDIRKYLPSVAVSFLLISSIFVLYATAFSQVACAPGSAGRYILHGAYGFIFYFLAKNGPSLVDTGVEWLRTRNTP